MLIETTVLYGLHCICAIKAGQNTCNICLQLFYTLILDNLQIEHSPTEAYICSTSKFHLKPKYNKHQLQMIQVQRGQNTHSPAEMSIEHQLTQDDICSTKKSQFVSVLSEQLTKNSVEQSCPLHFLVEHMLTSVHLEQNTIHLIMVSVLR